MSNAVSALQGASYTGYVQIEEIGLRGMITLRGDLEDGALGQIVEATTGAKMPGVTATTVGGSNRLGWLSPDELLILCPYADAAGLAKNLASNLIGKHCLAVDMSDARAVFDVKGAGCREVIAKLAPLDMSPAGFAEGDLRRSRLAQVPAAFWLEDATTIRAICFRSQAEYVFSALSRAAMPGSQL